MADQNGPAQQYAEIYTLGVQAGIKRDGTVFDSREYVDGVWTRFQRQVPVKMGGYQEMFGSFNGIQRGLTMNSYNGVNYVFAGNENTLDAFVTGSSLGTGSGPYVVQMLPGYSQMPLTGDTIANTQNTFTLTSTAATPKNFVPLYPIGTQLVFSQTVGAQVYTVTAASFTSPDTTVTFSPVLPVGTVLTGVWIADTSFAPDPKLDWQFAYQYNPLGGALNLLAHPGLNLENIDNGLPAQVYVGSTLPGANNTWTMTGLADTTGQNPTYNPVAASGGVVMLYPFIFIYGSNGFIANNNVDSTLESPTLTDWNGPLANQVNVAAGKIVKGLPIRGGTNAPSGLFWATDSLIRVSFVNNAPTYWSYDIVSSQISIMSSNAVVEMDGLYYWMGVDRFYVYNGTVNVLPNDKNINWLFNNINFNNRQKVWATKVPKYNEIWFFYPRGSATECTDAIIYNTKDKIWYDAGQAIGAQRSCGYTTETFPYPIWAGWDFQETFSPPEYAIAAPLGQPSPTIYQVYAAGDVTQKFYPGTYLTTAASGNSANTVYQVADSQHTLYPGLGAPNFTLITLATPLASSIPVGNAFYAVSGGYPIWQHEIGYNVETLNTQTAIYSSVTTCNLSWVGGNPSNASLVGINRRMHLRRLEPDFVQDGEIQLTVLGKKFANSTPEIAGPYIFTSETEKIDLRLEFRELQLKFESNTMNGNYQLGRVLLTVETGDERP